MNKLKVRIVAGESARKLGHMDVICNANYLDMIYNKIVCMTAGDDKLAEKIIDWIPVAKPGEIYEFVNGRVEIEK